jgi:hypothetical protein
MLRYEQLARMATQGDSSAALSCGILSECGETTDHSTSEAKRWYQLASRQLPLAKLLLAKLLLDEGTSQSEATTLLVDAAKGGIAEAATLLGALLRENILSPDGLGPASEWLKRGAELGDGEALWLLARGFFGENYEVLSEADARPLLEKALEVGFLPAASYLASIYLESADPQLRERGRQLLVDGARRHDFGSLMYLSAMYRYGLHEYAPDVGEADRLREKTHFPAALQQRLMSRRPLEASSSR